MLLGAWLKKKESRGWGCGSVGGHLPRCVREDADWSPVVHKLGMVVQYNPIRHWRGGNRKIKSPMPSSAEEQVQGSAWTACFRRNEEGERESG